MAAASARPAVGRGDPRRRPAILRRDQGVGERWRFASIELREPSEATVRDFAAGDPIEREAVVICWNRDDGNVYKARVALGDDRVVAWEHQPDGQPNMTVDEFHECDEALRRDPRVIEALANRGITDLDRVLIDTWAYGAHLVPEAHRGGRVGWADVWYRSQEGSSPYANPVTGLHFVVDLNRMELLEVEDVHRVDEPQHDGRVRPAPRARPEASATTSSRWRSPSPRASRSRSTATSLRWQKWSLRVGFNHREGMVLHTRRLRRRRPHSPVAHRLSFAEMVVPYRDPTTDHYRRTAFDIGEWGLGFMTDLARARLRLPRRDRLPRRRDARHARRAVRDPQRVCIHEEDDAILWKHVDAQTGAEVRRSRRLVLSFHVTVANYEYLVYWRLYQDGNVECEVRATGIMVTTHFAEGEQPPYGTLVDERTYAPFHQHFLVARLDLDVDGEANTVHMTESEALPDRPRQPARARARAAQHAAAHRAGGHPGLRLAHPARLEGRQREPRPTGSARRSATSSCRAARSRACCDPDSPVLRRAQVIDHTLWVTPFHEDERWPCGEFVVQSEQDRGLPVWTAQDRSIENTDVVLWYVFGIHHITRPEEWPVMAVDVVSFWLKPVGFFDRNPALDVPPHDTIATHEEGR